MFFVGALSKYGGIPFFLNFFLPLKVFKENHHLYLHLLWTGAYFKAHTDYRLFSKNGLYGAIFYQILSSYILGSSLP